MQISLLNEQQLARNAIPLGLGLDSNVKTCTYKSLMGSQAGEHQSVQQASPV